MYAKILHCNLLIICVNDRTSDGNTAHPACDLLGERIGQVAYAVLRHDRGVEEELLVAVDLILDMEVIGHERVPVVKGVKLGRDPVLVLETMVKQELWIKFKLKVVGAQVLHVFLNDNLDGFTCRKERQEFQKCNLTRMEKALKDEYEDRLFLKYEMCGFDNRALSAEKEVKGLKNYFPLRTSNAFLSSLRIQVPSPIKMSLVV